MELLSNAPLRAEPFCEEPLCEEPLSFVIPTIFDPTAIY